MLTGIVIAKNEEPAIRRSLKSLAFCDEIILIDNNSTDNTAFYAKELGVTIMTEKSSNDFSHLRTIAANKAQGEWLLYLDADEEVSPDLRIHIRHELENPQADAYYLRRRDHFMGHILEHGEVAEVYERGIIRLMKKNSGCWKGAIHEEWKTTGIISSLDGFIEHYPHQSILEFIEHINRYSQIRAHELYRLGKHTHVFHIIGYPIFKFLYTYVLKAGFRDGAAGFIYSFLMSYHSFLVRSTLFVMHASNESE